MKNQRIWLSAVILAIVLLAAGCGSGTSASAPETTSAFEQEKEEPKTGSVANEEEDPRTGSVAAAEETVSQIDVAEDGMVPVYGKDLKDGVYDINVDSSSNMFQVTACRLTVQDGRMSAVMTMSGTGYLNVYMGTGEEALKAEETDYIPFVETETGAHTYKVPVEALDQEIACSAFSKRKEKWYDRVLVFQADSLPAEAFAEEKLTTAQSLHLADGSYRVEVVLEGGSGKAFVESPARIRVEEGHVYATIVWGSSNYDYMKVDDEKFMCLVTEGNSTFEIPVSGFDWKIPVIADTVAMSVPHEITYTLTFDSTTIEAGE